LQGVSTLGKHCSAEGCAEPVDVIVGELSRLDLEAVVPVATSEALSEVADDGHRARFPLLEDVAVLMEYQRGILEKFLGTAAQIDAAEARRGYRTEVQPCEQRVLDDLHLVDVGAEQAREGSPDVTGQGNAAAEAESHGRAA
jgi:hypothetical protein